MLNVHCPPSILKLLIIFLLGAQEAAAGIVITAVVATVQGPRVVRVH